MTALELWGAARRADDGAAGIAIPAQRSALDDLLGPPGGWPEDGDGSDALAAEWSGYPHSAGAAARRRWLRVLRLAVLSVTVAVLVAAATVVGQRLAEAQPVQTLRVAVGVSDSPAGWAPEFTDARGDAARWDPCTPITYLVNPKYAPPGGRADVVTAMARLAALSGLPFTDGGDTTEWPTTARPSYQPDRYGKQWAPVLIAWASPEQTDVISDPTAEAVTVPVAEGTSAGGSIVTGQVVINTASQLTPGFGAGGSEGEVLLHEFGHLVGLAHVNNPADAMYPTVRGVADYGPGDLAGLAALGAGAGCHPAPKAHPLLVQSSGTD